MREGDMEKEVKAFRREQLDKLLSQCSEKEQAFFHRIFPNGVPEDKLQNAMRLVERTVIKASP